MAFEEELKALVQRSQIKDANPSISASYETIERTLRENRKRHEVWMNDVEIFYNKYLKDHVLAQKIDTYLSQGKYNQLVAVLESISTDKDFINRMYEVYHICGCDRQRFDKGKYINHRKVHFVIMQLKDLLNFVEREIIYS